MSGRPTDPWVVQPDDVILRRVARAGDLNMFVIDEETGAKRPSSGAFSFDSDGCSVYVLQILHQCELTARDVARAPHNAILSLSVSDVRDVGLDVKPDPWPPDSDGHPRDAAHALITNPNAFGRKKLGRAKSALARRASSVA